MKSAPLPCSYIHVRTSQCMHTCICTINVPIKCCIHPRNHHRNSIVGNIVRTLNANSILGVLWFGLQAVCNWTINITNARYGTQSNAIYYTYVCMYVCRLQDILSPGILVPEFKSRIFCPQEMSSPVILVPGTFFHPQIFHCKFSAFFTNFFHGTQNNCGRLI